MVIVKLQFLQHHYLEASWTLLKGGVVTRTTKKTVVIPDTPVSVMQATAFATVSMPIPGNVSLAKQETAGTMHNWQGVGLYMVNHAP